MRCRLRSRAALGPDAPVVLTVSVAVTAAVAEIAAGWLTEQVGILAAPAGLDVTAHARLTAPVKPPLGVMVMVEVAEAPGAMAVGAVELNAKVLGPDPPVPPLCGVVE